VTGADLHAVIRVRDTGVGISREMLPRIFDLFAQADRSLDRSQGGLGLGLTLVRSLVLMHGGTVCARSEGPGKGSEFIVRLPLASSDGESLEGYPGSLPEELYGSNGPAGVAPPAAAFLPGPSGRRVLVVDDNVDAAETLAELIDLWGYEVGVAHDGPAAVALAATFRPEVVLLDIGLPGMDGYEVSRRLRNELHLRDTLVVAVTGYGQDEDRRRSAEAELDHHLTKPVDPDLLRALLAGTAELPLVP
jgi:two-component system CheB/CheR fusion protein